MTMNENNKVESNRNSKAFIQARIEKVREFMSNDGVSLYMVASSDYHDSEYPDQYFSTRKYLSGFTGSAGTLVIGTDTAVLFTDGRYFVQAERELMGTGIELMRMGVEGIPSLENYIEEHWREKTNFAVDTRTITAKDGVAYGKIAEKKGMEGILFRAYAEELWNREEGSLKRPPLSKEPAFELELCYAGESRKDKLARVRKFMEEQHAMGHILSTLDDIAWLLNIRGNDIFANPMVLSYFYLNMEQGIWFVDKSKVSAELEQHLMEDGIILQDYERFDSFVEEIAEDSVLYDFSHINYRIYSSIGKNIRRVEMENPEILMKAVKNPVECENERRAHIKDGVAVTKFIYWLKNAVKSKIIDEVKAADYLEELRRAQEGYIEPSFTTISAYNANAAMMHYNPYANEPAKLYPEGILLVDSGGQYYEGTTDITRTIALGPVPEVIKIHYTAVLRGMLNLSAAKFLKGCIGMNLDILARGPLWEMGLDYRCGTGHGVGYLLGVHEAPNGFRWKKVPERDDGCVLQPGMITTNEPGVYIEGSHGIRIENELLTVEAEKNEYGQFLCFETLTMAPIEMELVRLEQMTAREISLLRKYQKKVYDTISSYLTDEEKTWLYSVCCDF